VGIASAGPSDGSASQAAPNTATITTKLVRGTLKFVPSSTNIAHDGRLTIRNANPGIPHTLTLVREGVLPDTRAERRRCFSPGHICFQAAGWHRALDNNGDNDLSTVNVGQPGLDTLGALRKRGDSVFINRRPRSFTVTAASGRTLPFLCIIHPWMQGEISVE